MEGNGQRATDADQNRRLDHLDGSVVDIRKDMKDQSDRNSSQHGIMFDKLNDFGERLARLEEAAKLNRWMSLTIIAGVIGVGIKLWLVP